MKKLIVFLFLIVLVTCHAFACEINLTVSKDCKKEAYQSGDEVIIEVQVQFTHRVCPLGIKMTKFTYENLKILGATEWTEVKPGLFTRQIKAIVTDEKAGVAKLSAIRKCEKEGGYAVCTLSKS